MLTTLIVVMILQCIQITKSYRILENNTMLYVSYTSIQFFKSSGHLGMQMELKENSAKA